MPSAQPLEVNDHLDDLEDTQTERPIPNSPVSGSGYDSEPDSDDGRHKELLTWAAIIGPAEESTEMLLHAIQHWKESAASNDTFAQLTELNEAMTRAGDWPTRSQRIAWDMRTDKIKEVVDKQMEHLQVIQKMFLDQCEMLAFHSVQIHQMSQELCDLVSELNTSRDGLYNLDTQEGIAEEC